MRSFTLAPLALVLALSSISSFAGSFVSSAEAEALVKRKWMLEHASNAHTWNFDRESCKPARAFAA